MSSPGRSVPKFLFCYACRPNFHHKYLTLSDPPLSACGEALISRHTCADRPEILKLEPRMRVFSRVRVDALMHVGAKRRSTRLAVRHSSRFSQRLSAASRSGRRTWLQEEATAVEERLSIWRTDSVVSLHSALLSVSFLLSSVSGQMRKGKPVTLSCGVNIYHLWYVFAEYLISPDGVREATWPLEHGPRFVFNPVHSRLNSYLSV